MKLVLESDLHDLVRSGLHTEVRWMVMDWKVSRQGLSLVIDLDGAWGRCAPPLGRAWFDDLGSIVRFFYIGRVGNCSVYEANVEGK